MIKKIFKRREVPVSGSEEELDLFIKKIERFAPRRFKEDRAAYYYNYRMIKRYIPPLCGLLELISDKKIIKREGREEFIYRVFLKLKDFYDIRGKLSIQEAMEDLNLLRRIPQIFLIFYGIEGIKLKEVKEVLGKGLFI